MDKPLALFCFLHPATIEKKNQLLDLVASSKPYYQSPESKCTTWSYFTPTDRLGDIIMPSNLAGAAEMTTLVASMEIYTDKSALSIQTESDMFKDFQTKAKDEALYAKDEEIVAWYPVGGFVSRADTARPFGGGVAVLTGRLRAKPGTRDKLLEELCTYAEWVKQNEPEFLSYAIMTRPKAPDEILIFERCTGPDAFKSHTSTPTFKESMKTAMQYIKSGKGQAWNELDFSFVGNVLGGHSKL